ncbi:MAG: serine hydrolase [Ignavibacteriae bacterium]|nr:serine hydrolase [Ignavibacteriota bacterium]
MRTAIPQPISKQKIAVTAIAFMILSSAVYSQSAPEGNWSADVAAFAKSIVEKELAPGMGIAIARGDRVVYTAGFGAADLQSGRSVDKTTMFYIASSTKSLTALAAVLAASRGELDLQAPISRYLPNLKLKPPLSADSITVENLITLTHGIMDGGPVVIRTAYTGEFTNSQLLELLAGYPPSKNGREFVYGNLGYNILGLVLETKFGTSWKEIVEKEVLQPLGMNETSAYVSRLDASEIAQPHTTTEEGFRRVPLGKADANMHAAGGHFATAQDLARYLAAHQSNGMLNGKQVFKNTPLLSTHLLHTSQDRQFGPFKRFGWGYGWDLGLYGADTLIHRFGSFVGYRSHMSFMPSHQLGVVVLVNGDGPASFAADLMATYIYDRLRNTQGVDTSYALQLEALVNRTTQFRGQFAAQLAERQKRHAPMPHPLSNYEGTYENKNYGRLIWRVVGDALEVQAGAARSTAEVYDATKNQLRVELTGGGSVVEFRFPQAGGPADTVRYMGEVFERVPR